MLRELIKINMSKLSNLKRIVSEDFNAKDKNLIDKLGFVLNSFMNETTNIINGKLDFDNTVYKKVTYITKTTSGIPDGNDIIKSELRFVSGIQCINAVSTDGTGNDPTHTPFLTFTIGGDGFIRVTKITGLQDGKEYKLTLILYP